MSMTSSQTNRACLITGFLATALVVVGIALLWNSTEFLFHSCSIVMLIMGVVLASWAYLSAVCVPGQFLIAHAVIGLIFVISAIAVDGVIFYEQLPRHMQDALIISGLPLFISIFVVAMMCAGILAWPIARLMGRGQERDTLRIVWFKRLLPVLLVLLLPVPAFLYALCSNKSENGPRDWRQSVIECTPQVIKDSSSWLVIRYAGYATWSWIYRVFYAGVLSEEELRWYITDDRMQYWRPSRHDDSVAEMAVWDLRRRLGDRIVRITNTSTDGRAFLLIGKDAPAHAIRNEMNECGKSQPLAAVVPIIQLLNYYQRADLLDDVLEFCEYDELWDRENGSPLGCWDISNLIPEDRLESIFTKWIENDCSTKRQKAALHEAEKKRICIATRLERAAERLHTPDLEEIREAMAFSKISIEEIRRVLLTTAGIRWISTLKYYLQHDDLVLRRCASTQLALILDKPTTATPPPFVIFSEHNNYYWNDERRLPESREEKDECRMLRDQVRVFLAKADRR